MNVKIPKDGTTKVIDDKLYISNNGEWKETKACITNGADIDTGLTMYDVNKQLVAQLPVLDEAGKLKALNTIQTYLEETNNNYYMLLCKEISYYTVFVLKNSFLAAKDEIWNCANIIGNIKSIQSAQGAVEIWVQPKENDSEPLVMYLFSYDTGVIECTR